MNPLKVEASDHPSTTNEAAPPLEHPVGLLEGIPPRPRHRSCLPQKTTKSCPDDDRNAPQPIHFQVVADSHDFLPFQIPIRPQGFQA